MFGLFSSKSKSSLDEETASISYNSCSTKGSSSSPIFPTNSIFNSVYGSTQDRNLTNGDHYYNKKSYEKAIYYYKKLAKAAENSGDTDKLIIADEKLGQTLHRMGKRDKALYHYRKALNFLEKKTDTSNDDDKYRTWYVAVLVKCGNAGLDSKDYENAIERYKKALPFARELLGDYDQYVLTILKNYCKAEEKLAEQYAHKSLLYLAIDHYAEAQRLRGPYLEQRDNSAQYETLERTFLKRILRIAQLHLEQNKPDAAADFFSEMLSFLGIESLDDIPVPDMCIENEDLLADILHNKGFIHEKAGNYDDAVHCYEKSISLKKKMLSSEKEHRDVTEEIWKVGKSILGLGLAYYKLRRNDEAYNCLTEAKELLNTSNDCNYFEINETVLRYLAKIHAVKNELDDCIVCLKEAVELARRCFGGESEEEVVINNRIAKLQYLRGQFDEALETYLQILHYQVKVNGGTSSKQVSQTLSRIGKIFIDTGDYNKALDFYRESLQGAGDDKPKAYIWNTLAETHYQMQENEQALECYKSAEPFISEAKDRALLFNNMGATYYTVGDLASAQPCFRTAISMCSEISEQDIREERERGILYNMSLVYFTQNSYDETEEILKEALKMQLPQLPKSNSSGKNQEATKNVAWVLNCMGNVYFMKERYSEALTWYTKSLELKEMVEQRDGEQESSRSVVGTLSNMGSSHLQLGQNNDALHCLEFGINASILTVESHRKLCANLRFKKGIVFVRNKDYDMAITNYRKASKLIMESSSDTSNDNEIIQEQLLIIRHTIALLECNKGNREEAKEELSDIYHCKLFFREKSDPDVGKVLLDLGCIYLAEKKYGEAKDLLLTALESFQAHEIPETHPFMEQTRNALEQIDAGF